MKMWVGEADKDGVEVSSCYKKERTKELCGSSSEFKVYNYRRAQSNVAGGYVSLQQDRAIVRG